MSGYAFGQTIELLDGLYHRPILPAREVGLERAAHLLRQLGDPHLAFRSVHVAGSTGKGSTTSMVASMLQAAGFRTGCFRSPHLYDYTERIAVDGENIGRDAWVRCFERLWPVVQAMENAESEYRLGRPSWFEVMFALMSMHFRDIGVEWAAVETGLGGRLDATNLLPSDVAVVTNVSLEHTQVLGKTVAAIAREKAAIIKPGSHAVTAAEDPDAVQVIEEQAKRVGATLLRVGRDVHVTVHEESIEGQELTLEGGGLQVRVRLPLAGPFQSMNAAAAFGAALALRDRGIELPDTAVKRGLETVKVPGRFEVVSRHPLVLLDGAHNPAGARQLRLAVERLLPRHRRVVLFATMADKDVSRIAPEIGAIADEVIITRPPGSERGAEPTAVAPAFEPWSEGIRLEDDPDRALEAALRAAGRESVVIVTGSLYLVGHVRHALASAAVSP